MSKTNYWTIAGVTTFAIAAIAAVLTVGVAVTPSVGRGQQGMQAPLSGWTSEAILRKQAVKTVLPEFPAAALEAHRTGVAVAMVYLDLSGHVSRVQVLRAPARAIADSMSAALSQWIFRPLRTADGRLVLISGKITFYFEIEGNQALVLDPSSLGYVGAGGTR
jgi:outer membrane biosynthesis protein TonB